MSARNARYVLQSVARERLGVAGERIKRARGLISDETEEVAALLDIYMASGISATEAADLLGMSRQSVYDLRQKGVERRDGLERRVLAFLAAGGAAPLAGLVDRTHADEATVTAAIDGLVESQLVSPVVMQYEAGIPEPWYRVTDAGLAALEEWIWRTNERPQLWSVYIPMLDEERASLERVAVDVFGPEWFAVLEPGTVRDQTRPELAFNVTADSFEGALEQARIRTTELHRAAGIQSGWAIRTILPADAWHAEFGSGG
jgi:DNA-binding MarR family transcriptional regulator